MVLTSDGGPKFGAAFLAQGAFLRGVLCGPLLNGEVQCCADVFRTYFEALTLSVKLYWIFERIC